MAGPGQEILLGVSQGVSIGLPVSQPSRLGPLLERRRSVRSFGSGLGVAGLAALLWSGYGCRADEGRVVPSAHALYRLAVTVVAGEVDGLDPGVFGYSPAGHGLSTGSAGDHRAAVAKTTLVDQQWVGLAPALLLITAEVDVLNEDFAEQPPLGRRGERYAWLEAGHVSQNLYLAAADLDLAAVLVAGFDDDALADCARSLLPSLPRGSRAMGIVAIGNRPVPAS